MNNNCKNLKQKLDRTLFCKKKNKTIKLNECNCCRYKEYKNMTTCRTLKRARQKSKKLTKLERAKATDIPQKVKERVWQRDNGCCIICGNNYNVMPNSHYIRRSHGGLGIEQNIFTACTNFTEKKCHERWDHYQCTNEEIERVKNHFKFHYSNWNEEDLRYKK